jgi:hypothetical protein
MMFMGADLHHMNFMSKELLLSYNYYDIILEMNYLYGVLRGMPTIEVETQSLNQAVFDLLTAPGATGREGQALGELLVRHEAHRNNCQTFISKFTDVSTALKFDIVSTEHSVLTE